MAIIRTSTYPKGPAKHLEQGDIVSRMLPNGRFKDCYVAELEHGDEYFAAQQDIPRSDATILAWMEENGIEIQYGMDIDGDESIELYGTNKRDPLVKYPKGPGCLRAACEFCLDMEDQRS